MGECQTVLWIGTLARIDLTNLAPCFRVRLGKRHPVSDSKAKKYTLISGTSPYGAYMALPPGITTSWLVHDGGCTEKPAWNFVIWKILPSNKGDTLIWLIILYFACITIFQISEVFFRRLQFGRGVYCYASFLCYANFSIVFHCFQTNCFWGRANSRGKLLEGKASSQLNNVSKHRKELFSKETLTNSCTVCHIITMNMLKASKLGLISWTKDK